MRLESSTRDQVGYPTGNPIFRIYLTGLSILMT